EFRRVLFRSPDLFVATDDRVQLSCTGQLCQITAILLERLIRGLGVLRGHALIAADLLKRLQDAIAGDAELLQSRLVDYRQQEVLGADEVILQPICLLLRRLEDSAESGRDIDLLRRLATGEATDDRLQALRESRRRQANLVQHRRHDARFLLDERAQQVFWLDLGVMALFGVSLRGND